MISGKTTPIIHIGYPTETFKSPMIYNSWFEQKDTGIVMMPMGVKAEDYTQSPGSICRFTNLRGALIVMSYKVIAVELVDEIMPTVRIAGVCNVVFKRSDRTLPGDQFDDVGLMRGVLRKGCQFRDARALLSRAGGIGSAVAASLVVAGMSELTLYDTCVESAEALGRHLPEYYPVLVVHTGSNDPDGFDVVANAMPVGMKEDDPLPFDVTRTAPSCFVSEVIMKSEYTPLLRAVLNKGCDVQAGIDILFEMVPAYLELFGFGTTTAEELRRSTAIAY